MPLPDPNHSPPVGWYIGSYLLRFVVLGEARNDNDPEPEIYRLGKNTVLVKAENLGEAYDKDCRDRPGTH